MRLERGALVLVGLDPAVGQEQRGTRPCVIVSDPEVIEDQRYPLVGIVPVTATAGDGALYPVLEPGPNGLRKRSHALVDQVRAIDKRRIQHRFGVVRAEELQAIDGGLALFFGLDQT